MKINNSYEKIINRQDTMTFGIKITPEETTGQYFTDIKHSKRFFVYTDKGVVSNGNYIINIIPESVDDQFDISTNENFKTQLKNENPPLNEKGVEFKFDDKRKFSIYFENVKTPFILYVEVDK